jgi:hypothetical protein
MEARLSHPRSPLTRENPACQATRRTPTKREARALGRQAVTARRGSDSLGLVKARRRVGRRAVNAPNHAFVALYFSVNDRPANVLRVMELASERQREALRKSNRSLWGVYALLFLGWLGFLFDCVADFNSFVFGYFGLVCWLTALVLERSIVKGRAHLLVGGRQARRWLVFLVLVLGLVALVVGVVAMLSGEAVMQFAAASIVALALALLARERSARARLDQQSPFDSRFDEARQVFAALKDDLPRKASLLGWLDLTGIDEPKLARRDKSPSGAPLLIYRDEWLRLKLKLWDGNILRLSAVESIRKKEGFWKRGARKSKWKAGVTSARHQLKISIVVDAKTHSIRRPEVSQQLERLSVETQISTDDRLVLTAFAEHRPNAQQLLGVMKLAYDHVTPRTAA